MGGNIELGGDWGDGQLGVLGWGNNQAVDAEVDDGDWQIDA